MLHNIGQARAVFLDRDGVINYAPTIAGKPYAPKHITELKILPEVPEALKKLADAGYILVVVTNQPDVAYGTITHQAVEEINNYLCNCLPINEIYTCYHGKYDNCECRKPLPGLLLAAAKQHNILLDKSYMIGDRWRDIEAGQNASCKTIFIDYGYKEPQPDTMDFCVKDLKQATKVILRETL